MRVLGRVEFGLCEEGGGGEGEICEDSEENGEEEEKKRTTKKEDEKEEADPAKAAKKGFAGVGSIIIHSLFISLFSLFYFLPVTRHLHGEPATGFEHPHVFIRVQHRERAWSANR